MSCSSVTELHTVPALAYRGSERQNISSRVPLRPLPAESYLSGSSGDSLTYVDNVIRSSSGHVAKDYCPELTLEERQHWASAYKPFKGIGATLIMLGFVSAMAINVSYNPENLAGPILSGLSAIGGWCHTLLQMDAEARKEDHLMRFHAFREMARGLANFFGITAKGHEFAIMAVAPATAILACAFSVVIDRGPGSWLHRILGGRALQLLFIVLQLIGAITSVCVAASAFHRTRRTESVFLIRQNGKRRFEEQSDDAMAVHKSSSAAISLAKRALYKRIFWLIVSLGFLARNLTETYKFGQATQQCRDPSAISTVLQGREIECSVLLAPSLTGAEGMLRILAAKHPSFLPGAEQMLRSLGSLSQSQQIAFIGIILSQQSQYNQLNGRLWSQQAYITSQFAALHGLQMQKMVNRTALGSGQADFDNITSQLVDGGRWAPTSLLAAMKAS